jgi:tRNA (guanine37-N1)-methyltransferase
MLIDVVSIFPEYFGPLEMSLLGKARGAGILDIRTHDLRQWTHDRHRTVDDSPYGGGAGMVMRADVLGPAIDAARAARSGDAPLIYMSPRGQPLTQAMVREIAAGPGPIVLAGRFEGIDQRVIEARGMREISIGDYILSGGELAAMVLIDAAVRLLPGVLGAPGSLSEESFESGLLEYPQYTRPRDWEGRAIPEMLLSGDHARIAAWRLEQSRRLTAERRPDLLPGAPGATPSDRKRTGRDG